jgi:hypothetical protein
VAKRRPLPPIAINIEALTADGLPSCHGNDNDDQITRANRDRQRLTQENHDLSGDLVAQIEFFSNRLIERKLPFRSPAKF